MSENELDRGKRDFLVATSVVGTVAVAKFLLKGDIID